jgi:D-alanyl-D-alanine carboxypeptidase/D-alanyl-D-alanine-endopeptidase (penicillin-binding protein 4)
MSDRGALEAELSMEFARRLVHLFGLLEFLTAADMRAARDSLHFVACRNNLQYLRPCKWHRHRRASRQAVARRAGHEDRNVRSVLRFFVAACAVALCATVTGVRAGPLPGATERLLQAADIPLEHVGAIAVHVDDSSLVLAHNSERDLQPASTLKTLTAIVALERLGPGWRARTSLLATAGILHGRLDGDLFLRGGGGVDFDAQALRQMLRELRLAGVRRITGDVVLDRSLFQPSRLDVGAPPFDETPEFRYNVIPDALLLNTNLLRLDLASANGRLRVATTPPLDRVEVSTRGMRLVERDCDRWEDGWQLPTLERGQRGVLRIALNGDYPRDCRASTAINVIERTTFADRLFRAVWRELGGRFDGVVRDGATPVGARVLAEHRSRTLLEAVREILKRSDNPITRQVYLTLGSAAAESVTVNVRALRAPAAASAVTARGDGGAATTAASEDTSAARSERIVRDWLHAHGLDDAGLVLDNGSGLSRRERIRPSLLAGVLAAAFRSPFAPEFQAMLPVAGVDGGMEKRLADSPAAVRGRFKTGTLRNVVSLAGYVPDAAGRLCVVVVMINHDEPFERWSKAGRAALDSVVDWVARSRQGG